jgi:hypothetical protein
MLNIERLLCGTKAEAQGLGKFVTIQVVTNSFKNSGMYF